MTDEETARAALLKAASQNIKPELVQFITFSLEEMLDVTEPARCAPNLVAWISDELNKRGQRKKDLKRSYELQRMAKDRAMINDPDSWPFVHLNVNTQPWVTEVSGRKFGSIEGRQPLRGYPRYPKEDEEGIGLQTNKITRWLRLEILWKI